MARSKHHRQVSMPAGQAGAPTMLPQPELWSPAAATAAATSATAAATSSSGSLKGADTTGRVIALDFERSSGAVRPSTEIAGPAAAPVMLPQAASPTLLSLVVPVYNEVESLAIFLASMQPILAQLADTWSMSTEVIFVDDGSTDGTREQLVQTAAHDQSIRVVGLSRNFGKEVALSAGLAAAGGDAVVPMDVDLQDPPEVVLQLVERWKAGWPIVQAVRSARDDDGYLKRLTAKHFYGVIGKISRIKVEPNAGDFQLIDRRPLDELLKYPERVRFMKGLTASIGFARTKVFYARPARAAGHTKWNGWKLWNFALDGITGLSTLPLRVWTYVGALVACAAFGMAAWVVVRTLVFGVAVPGYASTTVLILMLGGLNLVGLGVVGEYVGRISLEVRGRPLYHVDFRCGFDADGVKP